ncbi:uncharacterized protein EV154DRAFT_566921 [Mucor mucedo]|uniref:uncharacterized protein n=1 Tax=Mucor mucedo TaxID=29922 RepID=UPI0022209267|nr:uncharacterized protein EV154DRAFT_566921 [Mucor mucedo]KAI7887936.1 hypothetical protein EV154DRAFT_566921 [Mucor mucedo]
MPESNYPEEVNSFASMLAERRANNTTLSLVMSNATARNMQMFKYLPQEATDWLARVADFSDPLNVKAKLESVYGIDPFVQKSLCRQRLESLKQGLRRVAENRMNFETIVSDFPEEHTLAADVLRNICFNNLRPELDTALLGIVDPADTWKTVADAAAIHESILSLGNDHFLTPQPHVPTFYGPSPMEVDAIQKNNNHRCSGPQEKRKEDSMRRWAASGKPIFGICGTEGHLTKKCPKKTDRVHAVDKVKYKPSAPAPTTVQYVASISPSNSQYAVIPIEHDPIASSPQSIHAISTPVDDYSIHPVVHGISVPTDATSTPKIRVHFKGYAALGLIDTGASVTVMRESLAKQLNLVPDAKHRMYFITAGNQVHTFLGMNKVSALLRELPVILDCHVAKELSHEFIICYPVLRSLKAIIDARTNEVRLRKGIKAQQRKQPAVASVCSMTTSLDLPGFHHAYVDIQGPPNKLAFVSTPQNVAMEKLLSVAAGVVQFNDKGVATYPVFKTQTSSRSPGPSLDFASSLGDSLTGNKADTLKKVLREYSDWFASKASTVTPSVQHHIDTGDQRLLSQPPHRVSGA